MENEQLLEQVEVPTFDVEGQMGNLNTEGAVDEILSDFNGEE